MSNQNGQIYEYRFMDINLRQLTKGGVEEEVNEIAKEGWRLVERITLMKGQTAIFVFERPVAEPDTDAE